MDGCGNPDRSPAPQDPSGCHFCAGASVGREPLVEGPKLAAGQGPRPLYRHAPSQNKPRPCRRSLAPRIGGHGRCTKGPVAAEQVSAAEGGVAGAWPVAGGFLRNSAAAAPDAEARAAQGVPWRERGGGG